MRKKYFSVLVTVICLITGFVAKAQDSLANRKPEMATAFRADGKIYVVIAVLVAILAGLFLYVISLDRKISKIEK
jgi:ABC-type amino acid transport system permease subunit